MLLLLLLLFCCWCCYVQGKGGLSDQDKSTISSAALIGSIIGQLLFGMLADRIGRKKGFIATLSLVVLGSGLSCASFEAGALTVAWTLAIFRFILGVGIGGEYPLSATITSESSQTEHRGRAIAAVFSMQGIGSLTASLVGFILIVSLGDNYELMWRLALGLGAVPGLLSMYFRVTMEETHHFTKHVASATTTTTAAAAAFSSAPEVPVAIPSFRESLRQYGPTLLGTAGCWFLLDITFYANGLFSATVLELFDVDAGEQVSGLRSVAEFNVCVYCCYFIIDYYFTSFSSPHCRYYYITFLHYYCYGCYCIDYYYCLLSFLLLLIPLSH